MHSQKNCSITGCVVLYMEPFVQICKEFADRVHVSNHWLLVQALADTPVPNYDMP